MAKAPRNRTIDTPLSEGAAYLARCLSLTSPVDDIGRIVGKTLLGDTFAVAPLLPRACADLIIADPPYNLTKDFHGSRFSKRSADDYAAYTRDWLGLAHDLLRPGGTIYVCCDWESSLVIGQVLGERFTVRNRITWQREKGRGAKANWKKAMEDIWFATKGDGYTFDLEAVKLRRRVVAPYRVDGAPKDWTETADGNFRDTCPSNFWDDITIPFWSMPENTAHPRRGTSCSTRSSARGRRAWWPRSSDGATSGSSGSRSIASGRSSASRWPTPTPRSKATPTASSGNATPSPPARRAGRDDDRTAPA